MSVTYNITTNFAAKDALPSQDPDKVVQGADFSTEFEAIKTSFVLAAPNASPTFTGVVTSPSFVGPVTGDVTGNADSASVWETPRTITFTGDATGSVVMDGSSNESVAMTVSPSGHTHSAYNNTATESGATVYSEVTVADGIVTGLTTRQITLAHLGYTGDSDANSYVHPSYTSTDINTSGATIVDIIETNSTGHVTQLGTRTLTLANLGYTGATNANYYTHPSYATTNINTSGATIVDYITTNSTGHITAMGTRTLTAADLGALKDTTDTFTGTLSVTGSVVATGNITAYSDMALKEDIQPIYSALEKVMQIGGYDYSRIDMDGEKQSGVLAQELASVMPSAVTEHNGNLAVNYNSVIALLVEAVKELGAK